MYDVWKRNTPTFLLSWSVAVHIYLYLYIEGSWPEWCISIIYHACGTPFLSGTFELCMSICLSVCLSIYIYMSLSLSLSVSLFVCLTEILLAYYFAVLDH